MTKRRLGELLQAEGLITEDQVRAGLELQRKENVFLGEALVKLGFVSEEAIAHTIVQQFSLPFMSANQFNIPIDVLTIFPERMYYEYQFIAVDKIGKVLIICGAGLMNHDVLDELERLSNCKVCQYVSTWKDIKSALDKYAKDLRKEQQTELSSLGSMLLDNTPVPTPIAASPTAAAAAAKPAAATSTPAKPAAATTTAPAKPGAAPSILKPAAATAQPGVAASATAAPKPAAAPSTVAKGPPTQSVPKSALSGAGSQRLSALSGKPASTSNSAMPKVPTAAPNVAAQPAAGQEKEAAQAPPKTGLLGLFKKP